MTVGQLWDALTRTAPSLAAGPDEPLLTDPNDADVDDADPDVTDDPDQDTDVDPSGQMDRTTAEGDE